MLYHEYVKDDIRIRAESLAFLMMFSLLPLIAGGFFIFTVFAQFDMVQEAMSSGLDRFLSTIPDNHRAFVLEYVLRFKDAYWASVGAKSSRIGIFAFFVILWIGLQFFNNVDRTLNYIWSSDRTRPALEQIRNFLVVSVGAPLALIATLSLPFILRRLPVTGALFERAPWMVPLLNWVLPLLLLFGIFAALYRYVPVRRVRWNSALGGAAFASIALQIVNFGMNIYFRHFTQTAYGKAAVVPLIAFWIYVVWIVVILGAKVSFLMQNGADVLASVDRSPTLRESEALLLLLVHFQESHSKGRNPVRFEDLRDMTEIDAYALRALLDYLQQEKWIVECVPSKKTTEGEYALARSTDGVRMGQILEKFLGHSQPIADERIRATWSASLEAWCGSLKETPLSKSQA